MTLHRRQAIAATAADVRAAYFFGGAVQNVPVDWHVFAAPYQLEPAGLERYNFTLQEDPWRCIECTWLPQQPPTPIMTGTATTDAQGALRVAIPADLRWNDGRPITTSVRLTENRGLEAVAMTVMR